MKRTSPPTQQTPQTRGRTPIPASWLTSGPNWLPQTARPRFPTTPAMRLALPCICGASCQCHRARSSFLSAAALSAKPEPLRPPASYSIARPDQRMAETRSPPLMPNLSGVANRNRSRPPQSSIKYFEITISFSCPTRTALAEIPGCALDCQIICFEP